MAGVAAPWDSYGVGVGRGERVHFTIGETRGGVPGREGKAPGNQHLQTQQGEAGTDNRKVECAACVAAEDRAVARPGRHKNNKQAGPISKQQQQAAANFILARGEQQSGPITRYKFGVVRVRCLASYSTALFTHSLTKKNQHNESVRAHQSRHGTATTC